MLEAGHRDLVKHQPLIAPLRVTIDELLQGSDLDIATRGDEVQLQCTEMLNELAAAKVQVQPGDAPSAEWLFGLQLQILSSSILQPRHAADLCRFFEGISLVSQRLALAAEQCNILLYARSLNLVGVAPVPTAGRATRGCCTAPRATDSRPTTFGSDARGRDPR